MKPNRGPSLLFLATTLAWTLACAGGEDTDKPGLFEDKDKDGDGFLYDEDCNDDDASINPDAPERCDATDIDEDCDGRADNADDDAVDGIEAHRDADADGYGSANTVILCEIVAGYTADASDCNDDDPTVNPAGQEVCGGRDEDCDGLEDDADDSVAPAGFVDVWEDRDGDGYGGDAAPAACAPGTGQTDNGEDCDDRDAATNPAAYEVCGGADEDCDGTVDEDDATDAPTWYADTDGDTFGDAAEERVSCDAPRDYVADDTDCDDDDESVFPGAAETCDDDDEDCDGTVDEDAIDETPWFADADGDSYGDATDRVDACDEPAGYVSRSTDCDDTDAAINPRASERCDSADTDEDCDGDADDFDASTTAAGRSYYYSDDDGDGYGDPATPYYLCDSHPGYVADDTDCDDGAATAHPGGTEVCDARDIDEDCDGDADDDDAGVATSSKTTFYRDADADGYGVSTTSLTQCEMPTGYVVPSTDCDDTTATRSPGRSEVCDAANVDEDCDLVADDADASVAASGRTTWYADDDSDGYGDAGSTLSRCDQPAGHVADDTDCDDVDAEVSPAAEEVCFDLVDDDCDGATRCEIGLADADRSYLGPTTTTGHLGNDVADVGDVDGDGINDLVLAASEDTPTGTTLLSTRYRSGKAYLVSGGGTGALDLETGALASWRGDSGYDYAGQAVAGAGDLDGDGIPEIVVSAVYDDPISTSEGSVFVLSGASTGNGVISTGEWAHLTGSDSGDTVGSDVANVGDVDGDGQDDLFVGAAGVEPNSASFLLTAVNPGTATIDSTATARFEGESYGDGAVIGAGGDIDGDGFSDVLIGAYGDDDAARDAGAVYLVHGPATGTVLLATADAKLTGVGSYDYAGLVITTGDVNGDGLSDLVAGVKETGSYGSVYVVFGPITASASLSTADVRIDGTDGAFGYSVAAGGDMDGDGFMDLAVGNAEARGYFGAASVFLGPLSAGTLSDTSADVYVGGGTTYDDVGSSVAFIGSQDGTPGVSDLAVGAFGVNSWAGAVYVYSSDF